MEAKIFESLFCIVQVEFHPLFSLNCLKAIFLLVEKNLSEVRIMWSSALLHINSFEIGIHKTIDIMVEDPNLP